MASNLLVLGATGYIGTNVCMALKAAGIAHSAYSSKDRDLLSLSPPPHPWLNQYDTVINCVGCSDEDRAETDLSYRDRLWKLNGLMPGRLRAVFSGYLIHISSPFAFFPHGSQYSRAKWVADTELSMMPGCTLRVYPGWVYGGEKDKGILAALKALRGRPATIENKRLSSATSMTAFCAGLICLMNNRIEGRWGVYDPWRATPEDVAREMELWDPQWTPGKYHDVAERPSDACLQNLPVNHFCCRTRAQCLNPCFDQNRSNVCPRRSSTQEVTENPTTILPCPFCGSRGVEQIVSETDGTCVIHCEKCNATGPCPPAAAACCTEEAIADWNERHG